MIVYLHGFNSTPASSKAGILRRYLAERGLEDRFACPRLDHWPDRALATVEAVIARASTPVTLVGSSLGGFYANTLAERHGVRAVLLNPAVYAQRALREALGPQRNLYSGEAYEFTEEHLAQLDRMVAPHVTPERYLLIVETGDEVLDYREAVLHYRGARQVVVAGGDHSLVSYPQHLPAIVEFAGLVAPGAVSARALQV